MRLALRRPTHGEPDAGAFHELHEAVVGSNSAREVPARGEKVGGTSNIAFANESVVHFDGRLENRGVLRTSSAIHPLAKINAKP